MVFLATGIAYLAFVPVAAVVSINCLSGRVVAVHRCSFYPVVATVPSTLHGECEFSTTWLLKQPSLLKHYLLDKRPSQKLSEALQLFQPGNRLPSYLGHTFGYAIEGYKLM